MDMEKIAERKLSGFYIGRDGPRGPDLRGRSLFRWWIIPPPERLHDGLKHPVKKRNFTIDKYLLDVYNRYTDMGYIA